MESFMSGITSSFIYLIRKYLNHIRYQL